MAIDGLKVEKKGHQLIVFVERFSKELQGLIRDQLAGIFHGFPEVEEYPDFYSYPKTLQSFLDRFKNKSEKTKKGMIGELLAHVLIGELSPKLECLSVYKNMEERSIKKGFDIIYFHQTSQNIWYSEVKSGSSTDKKVGSNEYNLRLLKRSRNGILEMFDKKRDELWQSAMIQVKLAVSPGTKIKKMRDLLTKDAPDKKRGIKKRNVILVSVLYHELTDKLTIAEVAKYLAEVAKENVFENAVAFCIQKKTYQKVSEFLIAESKHK